MIDIKHLREAPKECEEKLKKKDPSICLDNILKIDEQIRSYLSQVEKLKAERNASSKKIGELKRQKQDASKVLEDVARLGSDIENLDSEVKKAKVELANLLDVLPNIPNDQSKDSLDPNDNVEIKSVGKKPKFSFQPKNHIELNETLHILDFKRGAKMSGTGWPVYTHIGARLEWALINYMIDIHIKNGFEQVMLPYLVKPEMMYGSSQLPKFEKQLFKIHDEDYHLYLIPTAEAAINALHFDEILQKDQLPKKYISFTPCFRREAGAAGSQERGLIRVHQFNKVEMFSFCTPEDSKSIFDMFLASAEEILQGLNMHYRLMDLVTGDMSFAAAQTVDVEIFLPGQDRYYEVSSVSNCTDFQARRSKIRYKDDDGKTQFVNTLNGSGLATARLMVGLLENNQQEDGSVIIPKVLHKYLGNLEVINPKK